MLRKFATSPAAVQPYRGVRLAALGDSIVARNHRGDMSSPTSIGNKIDGELTWARHVNPCFLFHVVYDTSHGRADGNAFWGLNDGVGGDRTEDCLARVQDVIRKRPDVCYVSVGVNDVSSLVPVIPYATTIANITAIVTALRRAGILVILTTIRPRSTASWAAGSENRDKCNRVNAWIRDSARRWTGVYVHDAAKYIVDPSSTVGNPLAGALASDDLHLSPLGAYLSGVPLGELLGKMFPLASLDYQGGSDDVYDATDNPLGNLCVNGRFSGIAGTKGAGATGDVATSWTLSRLSGTTVTCVGSIEANAEHGPLQVMTFTLPGGGSGDDAFTLSSNMVTGPVAGEYIQGGLHLIANATPNLTEARVFIRNAIDTTHSCMGFQSSDYTQRMPNVAIDGPVISEPFLVPATPGAWTFRAEIRMPAAQVGTVVVKVGNAWMRKVEDPATLWNMVA